MSTDHWICRPKHLGVILPAISNAFPLFCSCFLIIITSIWFHHPFPDENFKFSISRVANRIELEKFILLQAEAVWDVELLLCLAYLRNISNSTDCFTVSINNGPTQWLNNQPRCVLIIVDDFQNFRSSLQNSERFQWTRRTSSSRSSVRASCSDALCSAFSGTEIATPCSSAKMPVGY